MSDLNTASYDLVKLAILRCLNITAETHRVRFREYQRSPETHPRVVAERLCDHMIHWLTPEKKTNLQMGEAVVVEQFCHVVGADTQAWIGRHNPHTLEDVVKMSEDYEHSLVSARTGILSVPVLPSSQDPLLYPPPPSAPGPRPLRPPTVMDPLASSSWKTKVGPQLGQRCCPCPFAIPANKLKLRPADSSSETRGRGGASSTTDTNKSQAVFPATACGSDSVGEVQSWKSTEQLEAI
ncbi:UNVERIFIED_CONTAM: hypothetical protein FKN15_007391 [Acipenser sinensis]